MDPAVIWELGHGQPVFKLARGRPRKPHFASLAASVIAITATSLFAQQKSAPQTSTAGLEFPVLMQQKIAAGKTPVGTKVRAKLVIATLVKGAVLPEGAILSGEVTESAAKSVNMPCRLGIRMDSVQWRNGSLPIRIYLTAWYYPAAMPTQELRPGGLDDPASPTGGTFPRPSRTHDATARPGSDEGAAPLPDSSNSQHRVLMKNVESMRDSDGAVTLTSTHSNLKLDKATTYILAADGLVPAK